MTIWDHEKEFDSIIKLTQYLSKIQNLERTEVENISGDNWKLSFNLK